MYQETSTWSIALDVLGGGFVITIFAYPSIFFHELGHIVAAKIVGLNPTHLIVGESDDLFRGKYFGVQVIVRLVPFGGFAVVREHRMTRFQEGIFAISGVIGNLLLAAVAISLWPRCSLHFTLGALILLQFAIVFANLFPQDGEFEGIAIPNDGKRLMAVLFKRNKD